MECLLDAKQLENPKESPRCKRNGYDKQKHNFPEAFPNFMTLTDEERHVFFQTLRTAKLNLESSGVTVKPFFGTVHDLSWHYVEALGIDRKLNLDNEAFTAPRVKTGASLPKKIASLKSKVSVNRFSPAYSRNSVKTENPEKTVKEGGIHPEFCEENFESSLGTDDSLETLGFEEEEVEVTTFNSSYRNRGFENSKKSAVSSLSYEVVNKNDGSSMCQQEKDDTLKNAGRKLKVQVTLTSGDKEKVKTLLKPKKCQAHDEMPDNIEGSGKSKCPKGGKKMGGFELKPTESINDPEIESLLNVEDVSSEESQEEKERWQPEKICKKSFDENKSKEKKANLVNQNVLGKVVTRKKEVGRQSFQDQILFEKEQRLMNSVSKNNKERPFPRYSKTKTVAKATPRKEEKDNQTNVLKCNLSVMKREQKSNTEELKDNKAELPKTNSRQQNILGTTAIQGMESNTSLENQKIEVPVTRKARLKLERLNRVENLKSLQKRENHYRILEKGNDEFTDSSKKSSNSEEVQTEENSDPNCTNPEIKEKNEIEIPCDSEQKNIAKSCPTEETKRAKEISIETVNIADFVPAPVPGPAPVMEKKKVLESKKGSMKQVNECIRPFKEGKVVFVDDNVIEKIKNVIVDLEKKANAEDWTENEYLVLIVDYVDYLSTVMATLFEDRVLKPAARNPRVRFDEENLADIQQRLRLSTTTTEDELECNEQIGKRKKHRRNKPKKPSCIRRLKKMFKWGKSKERRKASGTSSDSSP